MNPLPSPPCSSASICCAQNPAPALLPARAASDYVLGIDMGGTAIKAAAFSREAGYLLSTRTAPTSDGERIAGHPAWAVRIRDIIADFARETGAPARHIGISSPGLAARDGRSIASMPNRLAGIEGFDWTAWLGAPAPADAIAAAVPIPTLSAPANEPATAHSPAFIPVLNDAHAALLGEAWQGAARNRSNVVMLTLGTGVGGAAMVDGRLLRGHLGRAGHLGHVTVDHTGRESSIFGMPGALETAIGNYNVPQRSGGRFADTLALVQAAAGGDNAARAVWLHSVHALACAIASFINAFDPEIVVLGGGIAEAGPALWEPLQRTMAAVEWRPMLGNGVPIVPAELGGWAGCYGAAWEGMGGGRQGGH